MGCNMSAPEPNKPNRRSHGKHRRRRSGRKGSRGGPRGDRRGRKHHSRGSSAEQEPNEIMVNAAIPIEQGQEYRASGAEADLIPEDLPGSNRDDYQQGQEIRESANPPQGSEHVSPESKGKAHESGKESPVECLERVRSGRMSNGEQLPAMEPQGSPQQLEPAPEDKLNPTTLPNPAYTDEEQHTSGHEHQPETRSPNPQPAQPDYTQPQKIPQPQPEPVPCGPCEQLHPSSAAQSPYMPAATGYTRSPQQSPMGSPLVNERLPDGAIVSFVGPATEVNGECALPPGDYRQDGNNWVQLQNNAVPTADTYTTSL